MREISLTFPVLELTLMIIMASARVPLSGSFARVSTPNRAMFTTPLFAVSADASVLS